MAERPLKIVLSRKGFDSGTGGCASPIFPNGRMYSLPIVYAPGARKRYCDIGGGVGIDQSDMGTVVEHLTKGGTRRDAWAHLDPDLDGDAVPRLAGWRPTFGQSEVAQQHLENQRVGEGDIFLFHGWFRAVERTSGRWGFKRGAPHLNVIFGWLQVAEIVELETTTPQEALEHRPWLRDHPHMCLPSDLRLSPPAHAIYVASEKLRLPGVKEDLPGAGVFRFFDQQLVLTAPGSSRSVWRLPTWFKGGDGKAWLTNFPNPEYWREESDGVLLRPRGRQGQEAVLDCKGRPEAAPWIASLIRSTRTP